MPATRFAELSSAPPGESSTEVACRVLAARRVQHAARGRINAELSGTEVRRLVALEPAAEKLLAHAVDRLGLSGRAHDRVLKLALTIHDLQGGASRSTPRGRKAVTLGEPHVAEALSYRVLDRPLGSVEAARTGSVRS